ncbi:RNA methyltransferase [Aeromonas schubertii]|uniref:TrmH family RNA methyltransferase n=1 Tax=Aeromonas schubertii TaxID=652 RepID=A0A0S2SG90_9GAMM|nr:RNA methyltransferase [Aeromonas schubertii]ALP40640.1 TrmH family RNA methyltransferase [Aeromonas schubertii]
MSQVTLGLVNPKSPENVGAVLRAAGCYGADAVFYSGVRFELAQRFVTDTKQMVQQIPLVGVESLIAALPDGAVPVAVDLIEGATPLPDYRHPENAFYIFGPEDGTLGSDITQWCRDVIYVPTRGCMNLAASVNVILYDRLAKTHKASCRGTLRQDSQAPIETS